MLKLNQTFLNTRQYLVITEGPCDDSKAASVVFVEQQVAYLRLQCASFISTAEAKAERLALIN